jgi:hypothetical protein
MNEEIIKPEEDNDLLDPIGDFRRLVNQEFITREQFHKITNTLKVMPEFLDMAKNSK